MSLQLTFFNAGGNINAIKRKEVLRHYFLTENPTIMFVSESNLSNYECAPKICFDKYSINELQKKRMVSFVKRDSGFTYVTPAVDLGIPIHVYEGRNLLVASVYSEFKTYSPDGLSFVKNDREKRLKLLGNALKFLVGMAGDKSLVVGGDMNFDAKQQTNKEVKEYYKLLKVLGFEQRISEITRPKKKRCLDNDEETEGGTIIDHVLVRKFGGKAYAVVLGESDHYAVVLNVAKNLRISRRPMVKIATVKYTLEVYRWAWANYPFGRPDQKWDDLEKLIEDLEEYMMAVQGLATEYHNAKEGVPWWTPKLTRLKVAANTAPKTFEKTKVYKKEIDKAQRAWDNHTMQIKGHPYRMKERTNITCLRVGGVKIEKKKDIAVELANFFDKKVEEILKLAKPDYEDLMKSYNAYNSGRGISTWEMVAPTREEVLEMIDSLPKKSSSGKDGLPYTLCKFLRDRIAEPIYHILRLVFEEGRVLDRHKVVQVTGVYKKGDPEKAENFRPVGIGYLVMRLIEKWIAKQIAINCQRQKLLPDEIHGFVKNKSCETCLISVKDYALKEKAKGNKVCMVFLDATAAFDTIPRSLILDGLEAVQCGPKSLKLMRSYLSGDWFMQVKVQDEFSHEFRARAGVIQGGGCSATLYAVATSIIEFLTRGVGKLFVYADDSVLVISSPNGDQSEFSSLVRKAIDVMLDILIKLGLKNNERKSEIMPLWDCVVDEKFLINGFACKPSTCLKFLGCMVNKHLTQKDHVKEIIRKMQFANYKIRTQKFNRSSKQVVQFIKSNIMSHIMYAMNYWLPESTVEDRDEIQSAMNKNIIPLMDNRSWKEKVKKKVNYGRAYGKARIESIELLYEKQEVRMAMKMAEVAEKLEYGREGYSKARFILPLLKDSKLTRAENRLRKIWNSFPLHAISFWSKKPKLKLKLYLKKLINLILDYEAKAGRLPRPANAKNEMPILWRLNVLGQVNSDLHDKLTSMPDVQYRGRRFSQNSEADYLFCFPDPAQKRERGVQTKGGLL